MKAVARILIVWILLLATPLQGFAAASMLLCESIQQQIAVSGEQQNMHATHHHDVSLDSGSQHAAASADHGKHHSAAKCNTCSACCMLVAMTAPEFLPVATLSIDSQAIPFLGSAMLAFVPESLDPPPRSLSA